MYNTIGEFFPLFKDFQRITLQIVFNNKRSFLKNWKSKVRIHDQNLAEDGKAIHFSCALQNVLSKLLIFFYTNGVFPDVTRQNVQPIPLDALFYFIRLTFLI